MSVDELKTIIIDGGRFRLIIERDPDYLSLCDRDGEEIYAYAVVAFPDQEAEGVRQMVERICLEARRPAAQAPTT